MLESDFALVFTLPHLEKGWRRREEKRVPELCWERQGEGWQGGCGQWDQAWASSPPQRASCLELSCGHYGWVRGCAGNGAGDGRPGPPSPRWALSLGLTSQCLSVWPPHVSSTEDGDTCQVLC